MTASFCEACGRRTRNEGLCDSCFQDELEEAEREGFDQALDAIVDDDFLKAKARFDYEVRRTLTARVREGNALPGAFE